MATAHTAEIAKRLSFGDITRNGAEESVLRDMTDIINASRNPSLDDVLKAVEAVDKTTVDRFDRVAEKVKEIAAGNGESDVRRLRRQFKSIKNTFIQYDVKDSFLEALSAGRPCAEEDAYHQQYQEEVDQFEANLKAHKAENRDLRKDVEDLIERVVNAREALSAKQTQLRADVDAVRRDKEAHAARKASSEVPEAEDDAEAEEQCRKLLEESVERARGIEEEVADAGARARELEKGLAEEEDAIEALKMELRRVRAAGSMGAVRDSHAEQLKEMHSWLQSIESLLESLGGVRVLDSSESKLVLALTTLVGCGDDVARGLVSATEPARVHHTLTVALEGGVPVAAEANPPIAGLEAAVEAAREGPHGVDFVVGEARRLVCAASAGSES